MQPHVPFAFARELRAARLPPTPRLGAPVGEADIAALPAAAQRYLRFMGVLGRPADVSFRVASTGRFRAGLDQPWRECVAWQYNTRDEVARLFRMRIRVGGVVPVYGHDTYLDGHGRMLVKLLDLWPVEDAQGVELDTGELVTWLDDAVLLAPSMLLGPATRWSAIADNVFGVAFTHRSLTVSVRVTLDEDGAPIDVETEDRFLHDPQRGWIRARWTTPMDGFTEVDGRKVPTGGRAIWHLESGPFPYGELRFLPGTLRYNVAPGE